MQPCARGGTVPRAPVSDTRRHVWSEVPEEVSAAQKVAPRASQGIACNGPQRGQPIMSTAGSSTSSSQHRALRAHGCSLRPQRSERFEDNLTDDTPT